MGHYNDGQLSRQWDGSFCLLACSAHFPKPIEHIDGVFLNVMFFSGGNSVDSNVWAYAPKLTYTSHKNSCVHLQTKFSVP